MHACESGGPSVGCSRTGWRTCMRMYTHAYCVACRHVRGAGPPPATHGGRPPRLHRLAGRITTQPLPVSLPRGCTGTHVWASSPAPLRRKQPAGCAAAAGSGAWRGSLCRGWSAQGVYAGTARAREHKGRHLGSLQGRKGVCGGGRTTTTASTARSMRTQRCTAAIRPPQAAGALPCGELLLCVECMGMAAAACRRGGALGHHCPSCHQTIRLPAVWQRLVARIVAPR